MPPTDSSRSPDSMEIQSANPRNRWDPPRLLPSFIKLGTPSFIKLDKTLQWDGTQNVKVLSSFIKLDETWKGPVLPSLIKLYQVL